MHLYLLSTDLLCIMLSLFLVMHIAVVQGSDTRVHTQKTLWVFGVNPPKNPPQNKSVLVSYSASSKTFYTIYCGWSFWTF